MSYCTRVAPGSTEQFVALLFSSLQRRLFAVIDRVVREAGCGDVLASWGDKYDWMVGHQGDRLGG